VALTARITDLKASLLADHLPVRVHRLGREKRILVNAVSMRRSDPLVASWPHAQRSREAGRDVEAFGQRDRHHVRRVDHYPDPVAAGRWPARVVQARKNFHLSYEHPLDRRHPLITRDGSRILRKGSRSLPSVSLPSPLFPLSLPFRSP